MKRTLIILAGLTAFLHAEPTAIFDGKTLDGWKVEGAEYWTVVDGAIVGESDQKKKRSHLWTEKEYSDFKLNFEFRYNGHIDSGVFVRHEKDQIQIGISGSLKRDMTASPYIPGKGYPVEAEGVKELLKEGEWNKMTILAKGNHYEVSLNGKKVMTYDSDSAKESGPIGLQVHAGRLMKVEFRNMELEEIKD